MSRGEAGAPGKGSSRWVCTLPLGTTGPLWELGVGSLLSLVAGAPTPPLKDPSWSPNPEQPLQSPPPPLSCQTAICCHGNESRKAGGAKCSPPSPLLSGLLELGRLQGLQPTLASGPPCPHPEPCADTPVLATEWVVGTKPRRHGGSPPSTCHL